MRIQAPKVCPTVALMRSASLGLPEKKAGQLVIILLIEGFNDLNHAFTG